LAVAAALVLAGLVGLWAIRGPEGREAAPPGGARVDEGRAVPRVPVPATRPRVWVRVVDGDTHTRVPRARVAVGPVVDRADRRGVATMRLRRATTLSVSVSAAGYAPRELSWPFGRRPWATIRIYRPALQWRMYGANPRRTQAHPAIRLRPPFRVVWSRGIGSLIEFPAVVSDGVAYIGNYRGTIYAISMRTGKRVWRYDPPGGKMASSPAVVGDSVVVHGMDGLVRVLDRRNGRLLWSWRVGSPVESSPLVRDGVDYFGAWNGRVYALDLERRRLRWTFASGYKITSSASLSGATLYIGDYGGRLLALSARTGRLRFARTVNGRVYGTPAVAAGRVFVPSSTGNSLTAFTTRGRYLWRIRTGSYVYSSPAVWAGRVYFGSYDGRLYAVSAATGRLRWSVWAGGPVSGSPVVVAGVTYAGSTRGRITGVDARSGRVLLRFPHGEYVPVSGNARLLLLHGYSRLYAVQPRTAR
jgi:outer membrane protein assembly factor BamB